QVGASDPETVIHQMGTGNLIIDAPVGNAISSLTKTGPGTLTLKQANLYAGPTVIGGGTLVLTGAGNLNGGTYAGAISGLGALNYSGDGTQTLSGANSFAGNLTVGNGTSISTLTVGASGANDGSTSVFGLANAGKTVTINAGSTINGTVSNWFGN